jgi:hypothetical protein
MASLPGSARSVARSCLQGLNMTTRVYVEPHTGRTRVVVEKFNPNHDPATGEFSEGGGSGLQELMKKRSR